MRPSRWPRLPVGADATAPRTAPSSRALHPLRNGGEELGTRQTAGAARVTVPFGGEPRDLPGVLRGARRLVDTLLTFCRHVPCSSWGDAAVRARPEHHSGTDTGTLVTEKVSTAAR
jgi:hypothetical protein